MPLVRPHLNLAPFAGKSFAKKRVFAGMQNQEYASLPHPTSIPAVAMCNVTTEKKEQERAICCMHVMQNMPVLLRA